MLYANPRAVRAPYPAELRAIMSIERAQESRRWLAAWPGLTPGATPLHELPALARRLGVARMCVKDESLRSRLGSFKALGASVALVRQVMRLHPGLEPGLVLSGRYAQLLQHYTVVSATDGNHGRSLAAAARDAGCRCAIVLHAQVSLEREKAIADFGAKIIRVPGNYDASVREAERLAQAHGWQVISDTSYEGYEEIPRDVMQGYGTIVDEILEQRPAASDAPCPYTHVFLQGGVGGLAAGIASYFCEQYGARRPAFIVVEPRQADCLCQSALAGQAAQASGSVDSVMAGLACGETSPLAWRFLQPAVDFFLAIEDGEAVSAMRRLAQVQDANGDVPVVSGESGAAGLAGLIHLASDPALRARTRLDAQASVLLISTEGATAPGVYRELVGKGAQDILAAQISWLDEGAA